MKKISQDYNFEEQYYVVLITTQIPNYQFVWFLNNHLKVNFKKLPELMVYNSKITKSTPYNLYSWSSSNAINYFFVAALEKSTKLSSEIFLLIEKREHKETVDRLIEKIASFDFIFSFEKVTSKQRQLTERLNNIAIDLEEHFDKLNETPKYQTPKEKKSEKI